MSEKSFQAYFMKSVPHGYRISLTTGGGFPDVLLIHGERHSLVELKVLELGKRGDRKLKGLFKPTQRPWYAGYLAKGGTRLFVVFRLEKSYGCLYVDRDFLSVFDTVKYSDLSSHIYFEYSTLKELIHAEFSFPQ